jgi:predicted GNAT family N-acyltransferase
VTEARLATEPDQVATAYAIRSEVFVGEQGVPPDLELDDLDPTADHFLVYDDAGLPVGAGRLVIEPPGFEGAPMRPLRLATSAASPS